MSPEKRIEYLESIIKMAARILREHNTEQRLATDLEDSLLWTTDPKTCKHPFWNCLVNGGTNCRTCGVDTSDMEGMGF